MEEENPDRLHAALGLRPGDVACELGAGNGYHTVRMAEAVGPTGRVYAVDIQPAMLALLEARAAADEVTNVVAVLAEPKNPKLGGKGCNLVLMVDVDHELDGPAAVLGHLRGAFSSRGRLAMEEFRAEDRPR